MSKRTRTTYERGLIGKIMRTLFIAFNILMPVWIIGGVAQVASTPAANDLEASAQAFGAGLGVFFLLVIWAIGAIILGALSYFTRGDAITEEIS